MRQGNIFTGVCQSFCSQGGVCIPTCTGQTPPGRHPLGIHPQADTPLADTPLADIPSPGQTPPPLGRHPQVDVPLPQADTPWADPLGRQPPAQCMLGYTTLPPSAYWDTHPLAQCMLRYTLSPPPLPPAATALNGTHPTGMHFFLFCFHKYYEIHLMVLNTCDNKMLRANCQNFFLVKMYHCTNESIMSSPINIHWFVTKSLLQ